MPRHTETQQTNGETDSERKSGKYRPKRPHNPTNMSGRETLRRRYKKYFGFKPVFMSEDDMARAVEKREQEESDRRARTEGRPATWQDSY